MRRLLTLKMAMTLTELIIASGLVGIVTLGLVAVEYAIRSSRSSTANESLLSAQLNSAMLRLSTDATGTVGNGATSIVAANYADLGIYWNNIAGTTNTICFRQKNPANPNSYANDTWNCWSYSYTTHYLTSCANLADKADNCLAATSSDNWVKLSDSNFYTISADPSDNTKIANITLTLTSRPDLSNPANVITNPSITLEAKINPPGLSR